jgi:short-subunit dehydrogenase
MRYDNAFALVTGASSGLGAAFAQALASRGTGVALLARRRDRLEHEAKDIANRYGVRTMVIEQDLTAPNATTAITEQLDGTPVDILINNAGFANAGPFAGLDPERVRREIDLDVSSVVELSRAFLPAMAERGNGVIVNVASTAALQPTPYMAVYGASKAFVLSFSQALSTEYRKSGVRVVALCPGPVDTEFFDVVDGKPRNGGRSPIMVGSMRSPESVVKAALRGVDRGATMVTPGLAQQALLVANRLTPRRIVLSIAERQLRGAASISRS